MSRKTYFGDLSTNWVRILGAFWRIPSKKTTLATLATLIGMQWPSLLAKLFFRMEEAAKEYEEDEDESRDEEDEEDEDESGDED
jgi:hypothetical protein